MEISAIKETYEKILEYATSPLQGTLSRKQRGGVRLQFNEGKIYSDAVLFIGTEFIRITESLGDESINTYYDWSRITSIRTYSKKD